LDRRSVGSDGVRDTVTRCLCHVDVARAEYGSACWQQQTDLIAWGNFLLYIFSSFFFYFHLIRIVSHSCTHYPVLLTAGHIIQCCSQLHTLSSVAHSWTHYPVLLTAAHIIQCCSQLDTLSICCSQLHALSSVVHSWTHYPVLLTAGHIFQCCSQLDTFSSVAHSWTHPVFFTFC